MSAELQELAQLLRRLLADERSAEARALLDEHLAVIETYAAREHVVAGAPAAVPAEIEPTDLESYAGRLRRLVTHVDPGTAAVARQCLSTLGRAGGRTVDTFHRLPIHATSRTGGDALVVELEVPEDLRDTYRWAAGAHVKVGVLVGGLVVERSYSVCAPPSDLDRGRLTIAARHDTAGLVSPRIVEALRAGDVLLVAPPAGAMTWPADGNDQSATAGAPAVVLVAVGSGITPLVSIAAHVLESHPEGRVHLLVVERDPSTVMLAEQLADLERRHGGRLVVERRYTRTGQGRPSEDELAGRLSEARQCLLGEACRAPEAYVCGPDAAADTVVAALGRAGWDPAEVRRESFTTDRRAPVDVPRPGGVLVVDTGDQVARPVTLEPGETLLAAMLRQGLDHPFSCLSGTCKTCRVRLVEGTVNDTALDGEHHVLACLAANAVEAGPKATSDNEPTDSEVSP